MLQTVFVFMVNGIEEYSNLSHDEHSVFVLTLLKNVSVKGLLGRIFLLLEELLYFVLIFDYFLGLEVPLILMLFHN
jgi:hypothetical protein